MKGLCCHDKWCRYRALLKWKGSATTLSVGDELPLLTPSSVVLNLSNDPESSEWSHSRKPLFLLRLPNNCQMTSISPMVV